jgi:hypothetical protein
MRAKGNKKPRAISGAGFFGCFQVCFLSTWTQPSARTSVGNEESEYKGKKERAATLQQAVDRPEPIHFGGAAMAVALRHAIDPKRCRKACQQKSS